MLYCAYALPGHGVHTAKPELGESDAGLVGLAAINADGEDCTPVALQAERIDVDVVGGGVGSGGVGAAAASSQQAPSQVSDAWRALLRSLNESGDAMLAIAGRGGYGGLSASASGDALHYWSELSPAELCALSERLGALCALAMAETNRRLMQGQRPPS
eukprot:SAG11_NODE_11152_length_781_cov_0.696481_1_plen_159_part_00